MVNWYQAWAMEDLRNIMVIALGPSLPELTLPLSAYFDDIRGGASKRAGKPRANQIASNKAISKARCSPAGESVISQPPSQRIRDERI